MDDPLFDKALAEGRPYFGHKYASLQGIPRRHAHMTALIKALHQQSPPGPFRILEVGSWAGGSAITWARALDACCRPWHVYCIDTWQPTFNEQLDRLPVYDEMRIAAARDEIFGLCLHNLRATGVEHRVILMRGASQDVLPSLARGAFDVVFVDGDHTYASVSSDILQAMPLLRDGGVLCGDDLELTGDACDPDGMRDAIAAGIDYATDPRTGKQFHPGVTAAVADHLHRVSVWDGFWAIRIAENPRAPLALPGDEPIPEHLLEPQP